MPVQIDGIVVEAAAHEANDAAARGHPVVEARAQHQHTALIQMAGAVRAYCR